MLEPVEPWANFYVIVGSSAGALTGLQFVVMTLVGQGLAASSMREIRAFGTPTVVHFCAALLISATMCVPWNGFSQTAACITVYGIAGLAYALLVIRHARKQTGYQPDKGDWFWYVALPLITYAGVAVAGLLLWQNAASALYLIAAAALLLLFVGIRNSWDTVTYVAVGRHTK